MKTCFIFLILLIATFCKHSNPNKTVTDRAILSIQIDGKSVGNITLDLFGKAVPRTVQNFKALCQEHRLSSTGVRMNYEGTIFHRIVPGLMMQGGDIYNQNGRGGQSIYGSKFADENFDIHHQPYSVAMASDAPNSNASQFQITFVQAPHLNGKHVVFGKVSQGIEVVNKVKAEGSNTGTPKHTVKLANCAIIHV